MFMVSKTGDRGAEEAKMSIERSLKQYEEDRKRAAKIAARLLLASGTTSPRVGGVGECTIHIIDDECDIEDLCQQIEAMAPENEGWEFCCPNTERIVPGANGDSTGAFGKR